MHMACVNHPVNQIQLPDSIRDSFNHMVIQLNRKPRTLYCPLLILKIQSVFSYLSSLCFLV